MNKLLGLAKKVSEENGFDAQAHRRLKSQVKATGLAIEAWLRKHSPWRAPHQPSTNDLLVALHGDLRQIGQSLHDFLNLKRYELRLDPLDLDEASVDADSDDLFSSEEEGGDVIDDA